MPSGAQGHFVVLPEQLRDSADLLLRSMKADSWLADVSDAEMVDLICSDAFRPILQAHANHLAYRLRR